MQYEVDYIPVGEGEKSGDAICLRYGNLTGPREEQVIVVIDGGDKKAGEALVAHIRKHHDPMGRINYVVSTHPDGDHASGLCVVLEELTVDALLMHQPWNHAADIKDALRDGRWTARGLGEKIEKSLKHASELEDIANRKDIAIIEPFQGVRTQDASIRFLGPSKEFYQEMLANFRCTPTPKESGLLNTIFQKAQEDHRLIEDSFEVDILNDDEDKTSAENNTSTVVLFTLGGHRLLFTGDAGRTGLLKAIAYADSIGVPLTGLSFLDVPHHGSRRNINSKILKKMSASTAFISATGENHKHPSKRVTNALKKHGSKVYVTRGTNLLYHNGSMRGWGEATPEPFHSRVEE